jgi:tetratricopeptide (TPR) repeat protein
VQLFARAQTPETNQRAHRLATQARDLAPQLAQAWMCLAYVDWRAGQYRWSDEPRDAQLSRSLAEAERAVELDARDPDAHYVLSLPCRYLNQRLRSDAALHHCLRLAASYAPAHGLLALSCIRRGLVPEAQGHCDAAFALSPLEPLRVIWHMVRAEACLAVGDPQGALDEAQRGLAVNPSFGQLYVMGAAAAWRLGALDQARDWVAVLRQHKAFCSQAAVRLAIDHEAAGMAQFDQLIDSLRQAGLPAD